MQVKGGILLLFSVVVTFIALGILFLLSSTSIANLKTVSVDYSGSQLIHSIQSGNAFINNNALPAFDENDQVTIQTIESGNIIIKRVPKVSSRYQGQLTFADLGNDVHFTQLEDNFTVSFWMKTQNDGETPPELQLPKEGEPLVGFHQKPLGAYEGAGFQFSFNRINDNSAARLTFGVTLVNGSGTTHQTVGFDNVTDNVWTFVSITYNGSQLKIYENKDLRQQLNVTGDIDWSTIGLSRLFIGKYVDTPPGGLFFSGQVRNLGIWNSAMTSASVSFMHNQGMKFNSLVDIDDYVTSDNLLGFWKLNDGTGTTLIDYSIFSKNGSILNQGNTDQCWITMTDSFAYQLTADYNTFQRTEHIR